MPKSLININTADNYTDAGGANINSVYQSRGGWVTLPGTVYAQIQHSPDGSQQGQEQWSEEFVLPSGAHYLQPGLIGIRFRNFTPGNPVAVSAAIFFKDEPAMQLGGSGISTPGTGVGSLNFQHNSLAVATEPTIDFIDEASGTTFKWTVVDNPGSTRVEITPVWQNPTIFPHPISTQPANNGSATSGFYADTTGVFITSTGTPPHKGLSFSILGAAFPEFQIQDSGLGFGSGAAAIDTVMGWNNPGQLFLVQLPFFSSNTSSFLVDNIEIGNSANTSPTFIALTASITTDTQFRFTMDASGKMSWGPGGATATDTDLYRNSPGSLTSDSFFSANGIQANSNGIWSQRTSTGQVSYAAFIAGDAFDRFDIFPNGNMAWGTGAVAADTTLARTTNVNDAHYLVTNSSFSLGGVKNSLTVQGVVLTEDGTGGWFQQVGSATTSPAVAISVLNDTSFRFELYSNGEMKWGSGTAVDCDLVRNSAGLLRLKSTGIVSDSASVGIGYITGAGGAVTQVTSLTTSVTLNTITGQITTFASALAANLVTTFTVNNTQISSVDTVIVSWRNVVTPGIPIFVSNINGGTSFNITYINLSGGLTGSANNVINFAIIRGSNN